MNAPEPQGVPSKVDVATAMRYEPTGRQVVVATGQKPEAVATRLRPEQVSPLKIWQTAFEPVESSTVTLDEVVTSSAYQSTSRVPASAQKLPAIASPKPIEVASSVPEPQPPLVSVPQASPSEPVDAGSAQGSGRVKVIWPAPVSPAVYVLTQTR